MNDRLRRPHVYAKADEAFAEAPQAAKDDLREALDWAHQVLTNHEGTGHHFEIGYSILDKGFYACFAKPQWNADHCSQPMPTAQEAIVMAVCEYLNGV